jgi:SSS family solute:Na+ symporter
MVGISLLDKGHRINNVTAESARKKAGMGARIIALAMLVGIVVAFFVQQFKSFALEAVFVLVAGFILLGFIIILNNTQKKMDAKGIIINEGLFKTSATFNIAAIGICGILAALYFFFW